MYTYVGSFVHPALPAFLLCTCAFVHKDRRVVNNKFLFSSGMDFHIYEFLFIIQWIEDRPFGYMTVH